MIELIEARLRENQAEQEKLAKWHEDMVTEFNAKVALNQNRFQQLAGAIAELEILKARVQSVNGERKTLVKTNGADRRQRHSD